MKLLETIKINSNIDLIYAKTTLKNVLKKRDNIIDPSFLTLSLMEISTNLIKYANGGEVWILEREKQIIISALDNGYGIDDVEWAKQKGTTGSNNSLGLGLYQISNHNYYTSEIISFTKSKLHGTVVIVRPKNISMDIITLQFAYIGETFCGDLIVKKGNYLLLADGSGHGKKAYESVKLLSSHFYGEIFSCLTIDDFFNKIHNELKEKALRGMVLSIINILKTKIEICGVGNIGFWKKSENKYLNYSQKNGILGEVFSEVDHKIIDFNEGDKLIGASDGFDVGKMNRFLSYLPVVSPVAMAISAMFFATVKYDDKTIMIISNNKGEEK